MSILELRNVRKRFGALTAVDGISLSVEGPGVVALLGPNGAGKTTTIDMLLGSRRPDEGSVRVFGGDPCVPQVRTHLGCVPQQSGVPENLRVREVLEFVAAQYPRARPAAEMLEGFGLTALSRRSAGVLSGGELRRLALALAFISSPKLVVLDEPTSGLDVEARRTVWEYVRSYADGGGTVLLTTHHMEEAQTLAGRIIVINRGRVVRDGTPAQIREAGAARRLVYAGDPFDPAAHGLNASLACTDGLVSVATDDTDAAIRALVRSNVRFSNLSILDRSLEDAVLSLLEEPV